MEVNYRNGRRSGTADNRPSTSWQLQSRRRRRYSEVVRANYQIVGIRGLYAIGFDPLLKDIERPQRRLGVCGADDRHEIDLVEHWDVITFVYPLWFGTPPAIIKGYIDPVFGAAFLLSDLKGERKIGSFVGKPLCLFLRPQVRIHGLTRRAS